MMKIGKSILLYKRVLGYMMEASPVYCVLRLVFVILQRISFVLLLQFSILWVTNLIESGHNFYDVVRIVIGVFLFSVVITFFERLLYDKQTLIVRERIIQVVQKQIFSQMRQMPYKAYDDNDMYVKVYRCISSGETEVFESYESLLDLLANMTSSIVLSYLFFELSIPALCIIFLVFVLSIVNNQKISKIEFSYNKDKLNYDRKFSYLQKLFYLPEYISEIKVQNAQNMILSKMDDIYSEHNKLIKYMCTPFVIHKSIIPFLAEFVLGNICLYCILMYQVMVTRTLTIGGFSALFFSVSALRGNLSAVLNSLLNIRGKLLHLDELFSFLKKDHYDIHRTKDIPNNDISVKHVSFSYSGTKKYEIDNVTLSIPFGKKIAIVGTNGAGKTTLIKLIIGLLEPQDGEVCRGGNNILEYDKDNYYNSFFISYQDSNIYAVPVYNNVSMDITYDERRVKECLLQAGMKDGEITDLGLSISKEITEDGVVISKGQKQKIALARALYSDSKYIIMDEPSSAMDPNAEDNLRQILLRYKGKKTIIIISHRLTTTMDSDYIYVMDRGHIVEEGTHYNLMRQNGLYQQMFELQAKKYKDG